MSKDWSISMDDMDCAEVTDISFGTKADYVCDLYRAKRKMLADLKFECDLLVDKYFSEIKGGHIPFEFGEQFLKDMFSKDKERAKFTAESRKLFLERGFSKDFIEKHKVEFVEYSIQGYSTTAIGVVLGIGDYRYKMDFPMPKNIYKAEDKERLMGDVKYRVDRIHKSKKDDFVKYMEPVCMPTYDWKKCFEAIEKKVEEEFVKGNAKKS